MKLHFVIFILFAITSSLASNDSEKCEPGHQYQQDCNTCTCSETGRYFCTRRACYHGPIFPDTITTSSSIEKVCEPGVEKKEDCNTCHCREDGLGWTCTEKLCSKIPVNGPGFKCEPNSFFMDDCNSCSCDESGTLARCTAMACEPKERRKRETQLKTQFTEAEARSKDFRCEANTNIKVDCNTCRCAADGQSLTWCTLIGCLHDNSIFANRTKREDNDAYARLERKGSILNPYTEEEVKQSGFKCEPDSSLKVGCKRCSCAKDGKSVDFCIETTCYSRGGNKGSTRSPEDYAKLSNKGSLLNPYTEEETKLPSFKCTPDASVKVDCKRCLCGDDGKTLTYCVDVSCYKVKSREKRNIKDRGLRRDTYETQKYFYDIRTGSLNKNEDGTWSILPRSVKSNESTLLSQDPKCQTYSKNRNKDCKLGTAANSYTEDYTESDDFKCEKGDSFWVQCNTCWCAEEESNKVGLCTRKSCKPKTYGTLPTKRSTVSD